MEHLPTEFRDEILAKDAGHELGQFSLSDFHSMKRSPGGATFYLKLWGVISRKRLELEHSNLAVL